MNQNPNDAIKNLQNIVNKLQSGVGDAMAGVMKGLVKKEVNVPINGRISKVTIGHDNSLIIQIPDATDLEVKEFIAKISDK